MLWTLRRLKRERMSYCNAFCDNQPREWSAFPLNLIKKAAGMQIWFIRSAADAHVWYKSSSLSESIIVPLWQEGSPYMIL